MADTMDTHAANAEKINAKAEEMDRQKETIQQILDQVRAEVQSLSGIWRSPASEEYLRRFGRIDEEIIQMLNVVSTHINDIKEAAHIIKQSESAAQSAAEGLPVDLNLR